MTRQPLALILCFTVGMAPVAALAQRAAEPTAASVLTSMEAALVELVARVEPSVVAISREAAGDSPLLLQGLDDAFGELRQSAAGRGDATVVGAGVLIDRSGLVLTQYLAVQENENHAVTMTDGSRYRATIRGADPRSGLAVLKIEPSADSPQGSSGTTATSSFPALRLADASGLRKGQFVVAVGNPYAIVSDGQATASWGIVSNLARKAPPGTNLNDAPGPHHDHRTTVHHLGTLIQTDAKLGWGAGGAALVNLRGELVGITTTLATIAGHEQPAGYAIPMDALMRRAIDSLKQGREVEYGMLGVGFGLSVALSEAGNRARLNVAQVYPGSPADRAGLQAGDVITRVGNQSVPDIDAVQLAISALEPASTTTVEYQRNGQPSSTTVTVAKLAAAGKQIVTQRGESWRGIRVDYATALEADELEQAIASGAFDAEGCVLVREVERDSAAWRAGVRPGMFISHVGGKRVATPEEFQRASRLVEADHLGIRLTQPSSAGAQEAGEREETPQ